jgi:hypothetical protein
VTAVWLAALEPALAAETDYGCLLGAGITAAYAAHCALRKAV